MSLLSLPNELILQIAESLPLKELSRLILTSRFFNALLTPRLYKLVACPLLTLPNEVILKIARYLAPPEFPDRLDGNLVRLLRTNRFLVRLLTPLHHESVPTRIGGAHTLHWAAERCHEPLVKILLEKGTDVSVVDERGHNALHLVLGAWRRYWTSNRCKSTLLSLLLSAGADANATTKRGDAPLHIAARHHDIQSCGILLEWGADANARNGAGETALLIAVDGQLVDLLCGNGADADALGPEGMTALHREVDQNSRFVKLMALLMNGADTEVAETAYGRMPLHLAALRGSVRNVEALIEYGANVDSRDANGVTPLSKAVISRAKDVVKILLSKGAMLHAKDNAGISPLVRARELSSNAEVIALMEEALAQEQEQAKARKPEKERKGETKRAQVLEPGPDKTREPDKKNGSEAEGNKKRAETQVAISPKNIFVRWFFKISKSPVDKGTSTGEKPPTVGFGVPRNVSSGELVS